MAMGDAPDFGMLFRDALRRGDMFALFDVTGKALRTDPDNPEARYFQALAMARLGEPRVALNLYERNRVEEIGSEDAIALKGRLLKDLAMRAQGDRKVALFRQASQCYRSAYQRSNGYFSGINAATTAFLAGDHADACALASTIANRPDVAQPGDFFAAASRAEAVLLCGDIDRAIALYSEARARPDASPGMIASTARQVSLIASAWPGDAAQREALLSAIRPAPVIHFCGHMFVAGWEGEEALIAEVEAVLNEQDVRIAYGPLACGADIVIAEAVLRRGGELHVVLPFVEEDFLDSSVVVGGESWVARYFAAKEQAAAVIHATEMRCVSGDEQFAYCSRLVAGLAQLRAESMQAEAFQLAVWDGSEAGGIAGTAADCVEWTRRGGKSRIITIDRERPPLARPRKVDTGHRPRWALHSMLFADFAGFSRLDEEALSRFLEAVMGRIASVLDRHSHSVLCRNSWGDAVFVVISSPNEAAQIALEIQQELDQQSLREIGLPADGGMRISLHHGPIFEHFDAVQESRTFYGTEVTVAARIEPRVPVGAIYTTQPFAAAIEGGRNAYHFEYVGTMDLAKDYGVRTLYRLGIEDRAAALDI